MCQLSGVEDGAVIVVAHIKIHKPLIALGLIYAVSARLTPLDHHFDRVQLNTVWLLMPLKPQVMPLSLGVNRLIMLIHQ